MQTYTGIVVQSRCYQFIWKYGSIPYI